MTIKAILSLNFHELCLSWSIFTSSADRRLYHGHIDYIESSTEEDSKAHNLIATKFHAKNTATHSALSEDFGKGNMDKSIDRLISWIEENDQIDLIALGHRIINGGRTCTTSAIIDTDLVNLLKNLPFLGDIEIKRQIYIIEYTQKKYPNYTQIACFDNGFHRKMDDIYNKFPISKEFSNEILPHGLHGLACEQILNKMSYITNMANDNIIIANLDKNCSSVCSVKNKIPVAASMAFSRLDGIMGINNAGNIGASVALYMMKYKQYSIEQIYDTLSNKSGMSAIAGVDLTEDLSLLEEENLDINTELAVDMFCNAIASQISALIPSLVNVDAIIFTSYIGENSPIIRKKICEKIAWFGVEINDAANKNGFQSISKKTSKIKIFTLPANEEEMVAIHSSRVLIEGDKIVLA